MLTNASIYGNKSGINSGKCDYVAYKIIWTIIHLNIFKNISDINNYDIQMKCTVM